MPHSEFVSGSGCLCTSLYQFTDAWVNATLSINTVSVNAVFPKGSSNVEPGLTPASNLTVKFDSMEALRDACGQSRLDGGIHFTAAIPQSYKLCDNVGNLGFIRTEILWGKNVTMPSLSPLTERISNVRVWQVELFDYCSAAADKSTSSYLLLS